jgi:phage portal protein BeeE
MKLRSDRHVPALRNIMHKREERRIGHVEKRATPGERIFASLFPNRGTGWPGGWSQDRLEQVLHMRNCTYIAINTILMKLATVRPNMAYVSDVLIPGRTEKAGFRTIGRFGSDPYIGGESVYSKGRQEQLWNGLGVYGSPVGFSDGGHSYLTMGAYRSKALSVVEPHEELEPLEHDHRLRQLWTNPNPWDTSFDWVYELEMFEELTGVGYLWLVPNDAGTPAEMWVLPSHWVWPRTGGGRYITEFNDHADELIEYYEVRPWGGMGSAGMLRLPPNEVLMFRWKSPINKIDGYARLAAIAQWIDSEESISKSRWSQFQNQARPEFWVELGPGYEDPENDDIARYEAMFAQKFQGEYNYGKPIWTPPGAKVTPLSFSPSEMAYFQSHEQLRDMIFSTFGVPKTAVGISEGMTYGSVLGTLAQFCQYCLNGRFARLGLTLTKHLASRWNEDARNRSWSQSGRNGFTQGGRGGRREVRIWYDDCVPADPQQVNSDLAEDRAHYAVTPDEVRASRGRRPYPYLGDAPLVNGPGGLTPLPVNTGMEADLERLAKLMQLSAPQQEQGAAPPGMGGGLPSGVEQALAQGEQDEMGEATAPAEASGKTEGSAGGKPGLGKTGMGKLGVSHPNGAPKKRITAELVKAAKEFLETRNG